MSTNLDIKYSARQFPDLKQQLETFAKNYFPDTYRDFSDNSIGNLFIEMSAYVGDILSFYQDTQLQETFLQTAKELSSLYYMAYMYGYTPRVIQPSNTLLEISQVIDAGLDGAPNWDQALNIDAGSQFQSDEGTNTTFLVDVPVNFSVSSSYDPTVLLVNELDINGVPVSYRLSKEVKATAVELKVRNFTVDTLQRYRTLSIEDTGIVGVYSIVDSESNNWYEVSTLGQSTRFKKIVNTGADKNVVPYTLEVEQVDRRFVSRFKTPGQLDLQFGAGILQSPQDSYLPDPKNVGFGTLDGVFRKDYAFDPSNFLNTNAYGLAPANTTLTVSYMVGSGVESNVPANTITQIKSLGTVTAADTSKLGTVQVTNSNPAAGGRDGDTVQELRENIRAQLYMQNRAVTVDDYVARALTLPYFYGSIAKCLGIREQIFTKAGIPDNKLVLYILAYDGNRNLTIASDTLKQNLKTYLQEFRTGSDTLEIRDAFILNIGIEYDISLRPGYNTREVLSSCNQLLKTEFDIRNWNLDQTINLSKYYSLLDTVKGVQTVQKIKITNQVGGNYSEYSYDIDTATRSNTVYPSYDPCIFEVKFLDKDIKGRVITV